MIRITGLYAALGALLVVILTIRVVWYRRAKRIGIGDGGDHQLAKRIRAHANAIEYLPLGLLLLLLLELGRERSLVLYGFGSALIVGRVLHALGLSSTSGISWGRTLGTVLTLLAIVGMALLLLWRFAAMQMLAAG